MANFYKIQYDDIAGNTIRCTIQQPGTLERSSTVIDIQGTVTVSFDDIDDPLTPIRPSSARINLEADTSNTFTELYSETEREWIVLIYRNDSIIFRGWLSPDGIFEDYVSDAWIIELEARDGLADLQNKAYVDGDGSLYEGKETLRNIIIQCLERTGWTQYTRFQHRSASVSNFPFEMVTTFPSAADFFDQKLDQSIFIDSDGKTAKSCSEVLEQVLNACNGHLYSWAGEWYVNWSLQHANPNVAGSFKYSRYTIAGASEDTVSEDVNATVGSHIKGFTNHWANQNQRIERRPSVGAARISYRFTKVASAIDNPELDNNGSTIDGWTESLDAATNDVVTLNGDSTVTIENGSQTSAVFTSELTPSTLEEGTILKIFIAFNVPYPGDYFGLSFVKFKFRVFFDGDGGTDYYLNQKLQWQTGATDVSLTISRPVGDINVDFTTDLLPDSGKARIAIYPIDDISGNPAYASEVIFQTISISNEAANPAEGIEHNGERVANPSSYTQPTIEQIISDDEGIVYLGTLFRNDGTTVAGGGYLRPTSAFAFPLYQCNVIDRLFIRSKVSRVFEGDVYGWIPYNARVAVDNFTGVVWVVVGWSWNTKENIINLRLFEIHWDTDMLDDTLYERIINYGNVIEPKIKG